MTLDEETMAGLDGGATWTANTINTFSTKLYEADQTTYLRDLTVAPERGRACMLHRMVVAATAPDSLCAAFLGGWSNVGMPQEVDHAVSAPSVAGWVHTWLAIETPQATGAVYTQTLTGAATAVLTTVLTLTTAGGESAFYEAAPVTSTSTADGILCEFRLHVTSGTTIHNVRISDGVANSYSVRVSVTTTTATLRDLNAGVDLASVGSDLNVKAFFDEDTSTDALGVRAVIGQKNSGGQFFFFFGA